MTIKAKCNAPNGYECKIDCFAYPPVIGDNVKATYQGERVNLKIKTITHDIHYISNEPYIIVELYRPKEII